MSGRILIIEDDASLRSLVCDYLALSGFSFRASGDGTEGLSLAMGLDYDLLILDVMLPGVDGFEICRRLREISDLPVLILSARGEDIDKIRGLGLGADDYVTKPFSPGELIARVKAHLARYARLKGLSEGERPRGIEIRGLRLDPLSKRVSASGNPVELTAKEFEVLRLLMANPDRVFSKEELFDRVWGAERFGDQSTVTVHIRKLREKIEENPSEPRYIETVWGMGYRIRA